MSADPVAIAARLHRQMAPFRRIVRVTGPVVVLGMPLLIALVALGAPEMLTNILGIPVLLAFLVTWVSLLALWVLGLRNFRNMFRPGSAQAYDAEGRAIARDTGPKS